MRTIKKFSESGDKPPQDDIDSLHDIRQQMGRKPKTRTSVCSVAGVSGGSHTDSETFTCGGTGGDRPKP